MKNFLLAVSILTAISPTLSFANQFFLAWPTPNPSFAKGLGYSNFLQKTGPDKDFTSGAYGCVRNHGNKFHEGLDLFPINRTPEGIAEDTIFSAMSGTVAYICRSPTDSAYGKYIVLEHEQFTPVLYTLYAHLEEIHQNLTHRSQVVVAQPIGKMGNTASFRIPLNRSHLHFEVGIRLSNNFDKWYNRQRFRTPNKHTNYNGYNLVGLDPLKFYSSYQKYSFSSPRSYLLKLPTITKVQINFSQTPDLLLRNPSLLLNPEYNESVKSWVCSFGPFGFPLNFEKSSASLKQQITVLSYDEKNDSQFCRRMIYKKNGKLFPSEQLIAYLELIFLD